MTAPLILGFDTSGPYVTAALIGGDAVLATRHEDMAKGQAERLMGLLTDVLDDAGMQLSDLTAMGVGIGPGNFTGIRISVAASRGLALSLGIPAIGVSLLEALAEGAPAPVLALLDARRDSVYAQIIETDPAPRLLALTDVALVYRDHAGPVIGHQADQISAALGTAPRAAAYAAAVAIARIAGRRAGTPAPRPTPLYVRSPDAAPSKERGPVMLDGPVGT